MSIMQKNQQQQKTPSNLRHIKLTQNRFYVTWISPLPIVFGL